MLNGCLSIPNYALGVVKLSRDQLAVTIWPVYVARVSVICAVNHGNQTIKTTLNATFIKRKMITR